MPLLDHFHPPLAPLHPWESFHAAWATEIMRYLNHHLPRRYLATVHTHLGPHAAADVAEWDHPPAGNGVPAAPGPGGVAVAPWVAPPPTRVETAAYPDDLEVRVTDTRPGARLVAVVELVSPANKDRPEARQAFAGKCAAYLQRGVGLVVADVVTSRTACPHDDLADLLALSPAARLGAGVLAAVAYEPRPAADLALWPHRLEVGRDLPHLPLPLRGAPPAPLDLEAAYRAACEASRLP